MVKLRDGLWAFLRIAPEKWYEYIMRTHTAVDGGEGDSLLLARNDTIEAATASYDHFILKLKF